MNGQSTNLSAGSSNLNTDSSKGKARAPRKMSPLSLTIQRELDLNETIALAAQQAPYAPLLQGAGIPAAEVSAFATETLRCRSLFQQGVQQRSQRGVSTRTERAQRRELVRLMQRVQAAALRKYGTDASQRPVLESYFIGTNLNLSHANLAQYSAGMLENLVHDVLPGISADNIGALRDTRKEWIASNAAQAQQGQAGVARYQEGRSLLSSLRGIRIGIQLVIDGEFAWDLEESGSARRAFHLPLSRPFRPITKS